MNEIHPSANSCFEEFQDEDGNILFVPEFSAPGLHDHPSRHDQKIPAADHAAMRVPCPADLAA